MARVTVVKKAQKPQGSCEKCGAELGVGSSYKWCAPRAHRAARGYKRKRCLSCPSWRPSETTSSSALSAVYGAQEAAQDAINDWDRETLDDLKEVATEAAEGIREGAEVYRESASNIEDGFGHATSMSEELEEKADTLDGQADDVENALDYVDEWDEDEKREEALQEVLESNSIWILLNDDGSEVDGVYYEDEEEAEAARLALIEKTGDDPATISVEAVSAQDVDNDKLPEAIATQVEERYEELRDAWADEVVSALEDALGNVGV